MQIHVVMMLACVLGSVLRHGTELATKFADLVSMSTCRFFLSKGPKKVNLDSAK